MVTKVKRRQSFSDDYLMTINEVSATVRCTNSTVRRWIRTNKLAAITLPGADYRIRYGELAKLIQAEGSAPVQPRLPGFE